MLAIIIPYYKNIFFEATLQSLANQTDKGFKVYIGDDFSMEDCTYLLQKYNGQFDFVCHRFEINLGGISLTQQWERCIALSGDEEWLMILGDDDVLGENVVEEFYKQHEFFKGKTNVVRFATKIISGENNTVSEVYRHPVWESATDSLYRRLKGYTRSSLSEYMFSKESFFKYRFSNYPLAWHSDDKAWLDFSDNLPIYSINEAIVKIRVSEFSLSGMTHNLFKKNEASILFYKDLINDDLHLFSKKHRLELLMNFEVLVKRIRKVDSKEWLFLIGKYLKNVNSIAFFKLIRRILIYEKKI